MSKILLVEDEAATLDFYSKLLTDAGFTVETAVDGEDGLLKCKSGGYDLIILDIMLPKIDGITLLSELKKTPPAKTNGPIIALTNMAHDPVLEQITGLGVKETLVKVETNPDQLIAKVKEVLSQG